MKCAKIISLAIAGWAAFIYGPFGYYEYINFSSGAEPDALVDFGFSMFVVLGNLCMYTLCDILADDARAISGGARDSVYVACFFAATSMNLILDVGLTAWTSYMDMSASGIKTDDGVFLYA